MPWTRLHECSIWLEKVKLPVLGVRTIEILLMVVVLNLYFISIHPFEICTQLSYVALKGAACAHLIRSAN